MKIKSRVFVVLSVVMFVCGPGLAQQEKKPLTNADVVQMVKAGLAENVIIAAIQSNPANFDTSPSALIELNKQSVSAKVQEALLTASRPIQPLTAPQQKIDVKLPPGLANMQLLNTIILIEGEQRTEMKENAPEMEAGVNPFVAKTKWVFQGKQADLRVRSASPVFELALPGNLVAKEQVVLIKPDVRAKRREIVLGGSAGIGINVNIAKAKELPLSFEEVKKEGGLGGQTVVYRVKPDKPLPAGEYVLSVSSRYHCFGVDAAK